MYKFDAKYMACALKGFFRTIDMQVSHTCRAWLPVKVYKNVYLFIFNVLSFVFITTKGQIGCS